MRLRLLAILGLTSLVLAVLFSSSAVAINPEDHWSGVWNYTADGGKTYGKMTLRLHKDHSTLSGSYDSATSGTITGSLDRDFGPHWCGKYKDTKGKYRNKGRFCATLESDVVSFHGWYNNCYYLPASACKAPVGGWRHSWSGEHS